MKREQKTKEQVAAEKAEIERIISEIFSMTDRVPAEQSSWSHQKSVEFKRVVSSARSMAKKPRPELIALREAHAAVVRFYV